jgi:hypothetical protein
MGNVLVVGAPWKNLGEEPEEAGAVYIFRYDGHAWHQEDKLIPSDPGEEGYFGYSTDISADQKVAIGYLSPLVDLYWRMTYK